MAKKKRRKGSLGNPGEKRNIMGEAVKPVGVIGGFLLASGVGFLMDKIPFLKPETTAEEKTKFSFKALLKPVVLTGIGAAGIYFTGKNKKTEGPAQALVRNASYGFTGGGLYSGMKIFLKKDLTTGLGESDNSTMGQVKMLEETKKDLQDLIASNTYSLNLPEDITEDITEEITEGRTGAKKGVGYLSPTLELDEMESVL